jgi:hypothetical protein
MMINAIALVIGVPFIVFEMIVVARTLVLVKNGGGQEGDE